VNLLYVVMNNVDKGSKSGVLEKTLQLTMFFPCVVIVDFRCIGTLHLACALSVISSKGKNHEFHYKTVHTFENRL